MTVVAASNERSSCFLSITFTLVTAARFAWCLKNSRKVAYFIKANRSELLLLSTMILERKIQRLISSRKQLFYVVI